MSQQLLQKQPRAASPAPGRRDPEGRRRAILDAACELIVENGTSGLTHRAIAARAGVALASTTQYFTSIDELREAALQQLADEIDVELTNMKPLIANLPNSIEGVVDKLHAFISDRRTVLGDIALISTAATDPSIRSLARRWYDRFVDMLAGSVGRECAIAIAVFLDGATIHAGMHEQSLTRRQLEATLRALIAMQDPDPASDK